MVEGQDSRPGTDLVLLKQEADLDPLRDETDLVLLKQSRVEDRFGEAGKAGWAPIPDVLLLNQKRLGINSADLNVLMNMLLHFYRPGEMPFVRPNVIAKRMGVEERTVQRAIARLRRIGLIRKGKHANGHITHDLTPLLERLQPFARERIAEREMRRQANSGVAQLERAPGFGTIVGLMVGRGDAGSSPAAAPLLVTAQKANPGGET